MCRFYKKHKKRIVAALTGFLSFAASAQTPSPCPPSPPMSSCSDLEGSLLQAVCNDEIDDSPGVVVINPASGADISGACENWLILAYSSEDLEITTSSTNTLNLRNGQRLTGVSTVTGQPTITFSDTSPNNLIHTINPSYIISNLKLKGSENFDSSGAQHALLYTRSPSHSFIGENTFDTSANTGIGINIEDGGFTPAPSPSPTPTQAPVPTCNSPLIMANVFELSGEEKGIRLNCSQGEFPHASIHSNTFNLEGHSNGIHIYEGGFISKSNTFKQTGPKQSTHQPPIAIAFSEAAQHVDEGGHGRPFDNARIECNTFDGGTFGELIPISLTHEVDSTEDHHNQVTVAHNIFRNVRHIIESYSAYESITGSYCNIWENSDHPAIPCPSLGPGEFIHFANGEYCGTLPEGFEVDCYVARFHACGSAEPLMPSVTSTVAIPEQTSSAAPQGITTSDKPPLPRATSTLAIQGQTGSTPPQGIIESSLASSQSSPSSTRKTITSTTSRLLMPTMALEAPLGQQATGDRNTSEANSSNNYLVPALITVGGVVVIATVSVATAAFACAYALNKLRRVSGPDPITTFENYHNH